MVSLFSVKTSKGGTVPLKLCPFQEFPYARWRPPVCRLPGGGVCRVHEVSQLPPVRCPLLDGAVTIDLAGAESPDGVQQEEREGAEAVVEGAGRDRFGDDRVHGPVDTDAGRADGQVDAENAAAGA